MPNEQWSEPVEIEFDNAGSRTVKGPFDALIYLHDMWPRRTGAKGGRAPRSDGAGGAAAAPGTGATAGELMSVGDVPAAAGAGVGA